MTRRILAGLPRHAVAVGVCVAVAVGVSGAVAAPVWADTVIASAHTLGVSAGVEDYVYASVRSDSSGRIYAYGYDTEWNDYEADHYVGVTLEERDSSGNWVVVEEVPVGLSKGWEGGDATTDTHANDGVFRACTTAYVVDGGMTGSPITVCTA